MARTKAERAADQFTARLDPLLAQLSNKIRKRLARGEPVGRAVDEVVRDTGFKAKTTSWITHDVESFLGQIGAEGVKGPGFRKWWLNQYWPADDFNLSAKMNNLAKMGNVKESIRVSMRQTGDWTNVAETMAKELNPVDLPGYIKRLETSARRVMQGDTRALADYRKALHRAERQISRLAKRGAPTRQLKAAYQNLVNVSRETSVKALDAAVNEAIQAKTRAYADMISRTEMAQAYGQGEYQGVTADPDVIGMGYQLSSRHPRADICDFHTKANLYGLKPGQYPLDHLPPYPFHRSCMCSIYRVYSGTPAKTMDDKAAQKFIRDLPADKRMAMLGVDGAKQFRRRGGSWSKNLRNYEGHKSIRTLQRIPKK